jgi:hypothetical protein
VLDYNECCRAVPIPTEARTGNKRCKVPSIDFDGENEILGGCSCGSISGNAYVPQAG